MKNHYQDAFRASPTPMAFVSYPDGRVLEVNRAFEELTGISYEELKGKTSPEVGLLDPETRAGFYATLRKEGRVLPTELTYQTPNGPVPLLASGLLVEAGDGLRILWVYSDISEIREVEEQLRLTQFAVDQAAVSVFGIREDGTFFYVNRLACRTLGYSEPDLLNMSFQDLSSDGAETVDAQTPWSRYWNSVREGGSRAVLTHFRARNGEVIPMEIHASLLEFQGRRALFAFARDRREIRAAYQEVERRERRFRTVFDQALELITILDTDGRVLDVNETALAFHPSHPARSSILGKYFWDGPWWEHSEELRDEVRRRVLRCASGELVLFQSTHPSVDGTLRIVEISFEPVKGDDGDLRYLVVRGNETTELARRDRALQESQERFRTLVESIPDVTWIQDREGNVLFVSENVERVFGFTQDEILEGFPELWWDLIHPDYVEIVQEAFDALWTGGEHFDIEYRFRTSDGRWIWVHDRAIRRFEQEGKDLAYGLITDITETKTLQAQLQQAQKLETLGTLASGIAHDFNNLLVPILGYADLVGQGVPHDDPLRTELEGHLMAATQRARKLVHQILTFSRKGDVDKTLLNLGQLAERALWLIRATVPASIHITYEGSGSPCPVFGDPTQLEQVIMNLCTNAVHATSPDGGTIRVSVEKVTEASSLPEHHLGFQHSGAIRLSVSDSGSGMAPEVLEKVFDPFFTTKKKGEGTGLGLSVVYGIVKAHGGIIEAESEPGQGTRFQVYLPPAKFGEAETASVAPSDIRGTERILVVDDQESTLETIQRLLHNLGYRVTGALTPGEAMTTFQEDPSGFDLALLDFDMPEMTGTHLALEILAVRPDLPILLTTGTDPARIADVTHLGIRGGLMKPFTAMELGVAIRDALPGSGSEE